MPPDTALLTLEQTVNPAWADPENRDVAARYGVMTGEMPGTPVFYDEFRNMVRLSGGLDDAIAAAARLAKADGGPLAIVEDQDGFSAVHMSYERDQVSEDDRYTDYTPDFVSVRPAGVEYVRNKWTSRNDALRAVVDTDGVLRFAHAGDVCETVPAGA